MKSNQDSFDDLLIESEEDSILNSLPDTNPFAESRPRKPWIIIGAGILIIILGFIIIYKVVIKDTTEEIILDVPETEVNIPETTPSSYELNDSKMEKIAEKVEIKDNSKQEDIKQEENKEKIEDNNGIPLQKIEDRKEIKFNPSVDKHKLNKSNNEVKLKKTISKVSKWYVQFGSYTSKSLAEKSQKRIKAKHDSLFSDKQFVILAAVLPNGNTTYRLRIGGFENMKSANSFCSNAKSDGLECYVTK